MGGKGQEEDGDHPRAADNNKMSGMEKPPETTKGNKLRG